MGNTDIEELLITDIKEMLKPYTGRNRVEATVEVVENQIKRKLVDLMGEYIEPPTMSTKVVEGQATITVDFKLKGE